MTMADLQPLRGRCIHCLSHSIRPLDDGWLCQDCGQSGLPPVCRAASCHLTWQGLLDNDFCTAPMSLSCYQNVVDAELKIVRKKSKTAMKERFISDE